MRRSDGSREHAARGDLAKRDLGEKSVATLRPLIVPAVFILLPRKLSSASGRGALAVVNEEQVAFVVGALAAQLGIPGRRTVFSGMCGEALRPRPQPHARPIRSRPTRSRGPL